MNLYPVCLIAEKPSQLRAYLEVVPASNYQKIEPYYYLISPCKAFPQGCHALSCRGFLMSLQDPAAYPGLERLKEWNVDDVPFPIPRPYVYIPGDGNGIKQQLENLKSVIRRSITHFGANNVTLITATDIDASGAQIAQQVYDYSLTPDEWQAVNKRTLFINSLEKTEVFKGLMNLRNYDLTARMSESSRAKQGSDWILGLSLTRLVTIVAKDEVVKAIQRLNNNTAYLSKLFKAQNKELPKISITAEDIFPRGSSARIGRVSSPTLHFIYNRENEIQNFKPQDFFELFATFQTDRGERYKGKLQGFKTFEPNEVSSLLAKHHLQENLMNQAIVKDIKTERKKKGAPPLHSLNTLQATANRKWKMTAKQTLNVLQQLYEAKLLSYPRASSNKITTNEFAYLLENLDKYKEALNFQFENTYLTPRKKYTDNDAVAEHHAIILTRNIATLQKLNEMSEAERNIYLEVARTTLGMFAPDYEYDQTTVITDINQLPFKSVGKIERVLGFEVLWSDKNNVSEKQVGKDEDETQDQSLPPLSLGQQINGQINVKQGKTQPPLRYTEAMLLEAMETAGKFVESEEERLILKEVEGIGTAATRADIIANLKDAQYVKLEANRFVPTPKAMLVCRITRGTMLSNPETTAKWEMYLKNIEKGLGNASADVFIERNIQFIQHFKGAFIENITQPTIQQYIEATVLSVNKNIADSRIVCPKCKKGEVRSFQSKDKKSTFYSCSTYNTEAACGFSMSTNFYGNKLTKAQINQLLNKGITRSEVKLKSKNDKEYKAKIRLHPETFKMEVVFDQSFNSDKRGK